MARDCCAGKKLGMTGYTRIIGILLSSLFLSTGTDCRADEPLPVVEMAQAPLSTPGAEPAPAAEKQTQGDSLTGATSAWNLSGFYQAEAAYTVASPDHWSKLRNTLELGVQRKLTDEVELKVSGRFWYDAVYDVTTFFPGSVRRNARFDAMFRETYLDVGAGDWDFRVGRQHIIWGEVVGLFFADVVSARDL